MTIDVIRASIGDIVADTACNLVTYFVVKDAAGGLTIKMADFTATAQADLKNQFKEELNSAIVLNDSLSLMKISLADGRADVIFEYDIPYLDQAAEIKLMDQLTTTANFSNFSFATDGVDKIKAIIMQVGTATKNIVIYKHVYPVNLFDKKGIFQFVRDRIEVVNESMIRIGGGFDFFMIDNIKYVMNINLLEKKYGFDSFLKKSAESVLLLIKNVNLIQDVTNFEARLTDKAFCRKLGRVSSQSLILSGTVSHASVVGFITNHPKLKTKLRCDSVNNQIILDTKVSHDILIELLRDSYLRSELTNENYHAIAKDSL